MIVPPDIDIETASREEVISAYLVIGMTREEAEAYTALLLDGPDPDDPPVI